jgi:hypothetical protein
MATEGLTPILLGVAVVIASIVLFKLLQSKKFLDKTRQQLVLGERVNLSHDTVRFRFMLPKATPVLGLPVGKHFKIFAPNPKPSVAGQWNNNEDKEAGDSEIERKYTPTTSDNEHGYVDLVIKVYKSGVVDRFPDGGKMSQYMDSLKVRRECCTSGAAHISHAVRYGTCCSTMPAPHSRNRARASPASTCAGR